MVCSLFPLPLPSSFCFFPRRALPVSLLFPSPSLSPLSFIFSACAHSYSHHPSLSSFSFFFPLLICPFLSSLSTPSPFPAIFFLSSSLLPFFPIFYFSLLSLLLPPRLSLFLSCPSPRVFSSSLSLISFLSLYILILISSLISLLHFRPLSFPPCFSSLPNPHSLSIISIYPFSPSLFLPPCYLPRRRGCCSPSRSGLPLPLRVREMAGFLLFSLTLSRLVRLVRTFVFLFSSLSIYLHRLRLVFLLFHTISFLSTFVWCFFFVGGAVISSVVFCYFLVRVKEC